MNNFIQQQGAMQNQVMRFTDLDQRCNKWLVEFEENEKEFHRSVLMVRERDQQLRENAKNISELNQSLQNVLKIQTKVENELDFITSQHTEIQAELEKLESECNDKCKSGVIGCDSVMDKQRKSINDMLINLDDVIQNISGEVDQLVNQFYENTDGQQVKQIAKILNSQMESLQVLEKTLKDEKES
ncbi:hypothetical protein GJ496_005422 [Pomphorhynchus laevis]|nr:hypothetical protein GJ496_005422 [Pomphorhynchus laevis]